jgi:CheY-like chemotaxis protein
VGTRRQFGQREYDVTTDLCKVLVVDDNRNAADSAVMLLKIWGHEAVAAYSGEQCVEIVKQFDPDVILMDIGLPRVDGFKVKDEVERADSAFNRRYVSRRSAGSSAKVSRSRSVAAAVRGEPPLATPRLLHLSTTTTEIGRAP